MTRLQRRLGMSADSMSMLLGIALLFSLATPILHCLSLVANGQATIDDPISELSQGRWGFIHTLSIVLFGTAQIMLAVGLGRLDTGRCWPVGRALLSIAGALLFLVAYFFAVPDHSAGQGLAYNDPLWVVATLVGITMGLLQPGLSRISRWSGAFNVGCTVVWLGLIPASLLIGLISLGAYERTVGLVYVVWVAGISLACLEVRSSEGEHP